MKRIGSIGYGENPEFRSFAQCTRMVWAKIQVYDMCHTLWEYDIPGMTRLLEELGFPMTEIQEKVKS